LPIGKAEFEKGKPIRALGDRILEFLSMNKGNAYVGDDVATEIMQADGGDPTLQSLTIVGRQAVVLAVLDNLVREGKVVARKSSWNVYYTYNDAATTSHGSSTQFASEALIAAAKQLGISTEGKTKEEIAREIAEKASKK
jgi:hypothetical protein